MPTDMLALINEPQLPNHAFNAADRRRDAQVKTFISQSLSDAIGDEIAIQVFSHPNMTSRARFVYLQTKYGRQPIVLAELAMITDYEQTKMKATLALKRNSIENLMLERTR